MILLVNAYGGPAILIQHAQESRVLCNYNSDDSSWRGTFRLEPVTPLLTLGKATLRLPGGREGDVIIEQVEITKDGDLPWGKFVGSGPPPRGAD